MVNLKLTMTRLRQWANRRLHIEPCPASAWGHQWRHSHAWNSGKRSRFTGDVMGRWGSRCYHCCEMRWDQSEAEFEAAIRNVVASDDDLRVRELI